MDQTERSFVSRVGNSLLVAAVFGTPDLASGWSPYHFNLVLLPVLLLCFLRNRALCRSWLPLLRARFVCKVPVEKAPRIGRIKVSWRLRTRFDPSYGTMSEGQEAIKRIFAIEMVVAPMTVKTTVVGP
jgi:hypothetical protein